MKRRGFLKLLGAAATAPLLVNAEKVDALPKNAREVGTFPVVHQKDGKQFQAFRAYQDFRAGDIVCLESGHCAGVAVGPVTKGNYGFMQIQGACSVNVHA